MLRSLFSGISGMRAHQQMMDVTGNNIANINTTGFKGSQATFEDTLSQLVRSAGAPQGLDAGTNPAQVGLGVKLGSITTNFAQGAAQTTGRATDLMIQGDGFFVVKSGSEMLFTRNGSFSFDANGVLSTSGGAIVQGWLADDDGVINTNATPENVTLPIGTLLQPKATTTAVFGGNLPADDAVGTRITTSQTVYDGQGAPSTLAVTMTKATATRWTVSVDGGTTTLASINFGANGQIDYDPTLTPATPTGALVDDGSGLMIDLSRLTLYAGESTVNPQTQDGYAMGSLQAFTFAADGTLIGVFSNGLKQSLAQLALANFNNPPGLEKAGESMFRNTVNSGPAQLGVSGEGGRGLLQSGALEMSNVDLAQEFTNLVIAQRGFQANSRVITTSDELLQDLVNLKR